LQHYDGDCISWGGDAIDQAFETFVKGLDANEHHTSVVEVGQVVVGGEEHFALVNGPDLSQRRAKKLGAYSVMRRINTCLQKMRVKRSEHKWAVGTNELNRLHEGADGLVCRAMLAEKRYQHARNIAKFSIDKLDLFHYNVASHDL
jgi:hypothetical protein